MFLDVNSGGNGTQTDNKSAITNLTKHSILFAKALKKKQKKVSKCERKLQEWFIKVNDAFSKPHRLLISFNDGKLIPTTPQNNKY